MKAKIICTTILVERSPQAIPLGAACVASAIKHSQLTKDYCDVSLKTFYPEDDAAEIARALLLDFGNKDDGDRLCVCAFSVFVWNRLVLEKVAAALREKGVICIAGGPEITAGLRDKANTLPDTARTCDEVSSNSSFDYFVCGEGEFSVPQLIKKIVSEPASVQTPTVIPAISS